MEQRRPEVAPDRNRMLAFAGAQAMDPIPRHKIAFSIPDVDGASFVFSRAWHAVVIDQNVKRELPPPGIAAALDRCDAAVEKFEVQCGVFDLFHSVFLQFSIKSDFLHK
ncbi:hypothetical protein SDC9_104278 [bioreactor metagenome]|uniref:Uncharacterized protein n=1 Tax=bioreactor metagenome TaxID=1076179 RepID=A0A645AXD0_9ZZZZ